MIRKKWILSFFFITFSATFDRLKFGHMAEHITRNIRFCLLSSIGFFGIALLLLKSHKGLILRRTFYSLLLYVCISTQHFKSYNALKRKMNPIQSHFIEKINTLNRELQPSYGLEFIFMQYMFCIPEV